MKNVKKVNLSIKDMRDKGKPKSEVLTANVREYAGNIAFCEFQMNFKQYPELKNILLMLSIEIEPDRVYKS